MKPKKRIASPAYATVPPCSHGARRVRLTVDQNSMSTSINGLEHLSRTPKYISAAWLNVVAAPLRAGCQTKISQLRRWVTGSVGSCSAQSMRRKEIGSGALTRAQ